MEVINEGLVEPDTIELAPTRKLMLDACTCTGNCDACTCTGNC